MIVEPVSPAAAGASAEPDWDAIEKSPDFRALVAAKWRFIVPATVFFLAYYFALPILSGYAPDLMKMPVIGPVNVANLFALSQFVMVAVVMSLYVSRAKTYDAQAAAVTANIVRKSS
jgi:uncharacterized membrane protein (DUF485 family)